MKFEVGTVIKIKSGITYFKCAHGGYQSGDVGTIISFYDECRIRVRFHTPDSEDGQPRKNFMVNTDECVPASKLDKVLA